MQHPTATEVSEMVDFLLAKVDQFAMVQCTPEELLAIVPDEVRLRRLFTHFYFKTDFLGVGIKLHIGKKQFVSNFQHYVFEEEFSSAVNIAKELQSPCGLNPINLYRYQQTVRENFGEQIISIVALEKITQMIVGFFSGNKEQLETLLFKEAGLPLVLIPDVRSNPYKWVKESFTVLAKSKDKKDQSALFFILETFCHQARFDGDVNKAEEIRRYISNLIEPDGYGFKGERITKNEGPVFDFVDPVLKRGNKELLLTELQVKIIGLMFAHDIGAYIDVNDASLHVYGNDRIQTVEKLRTLVNDLNKRVCKEFRVEGRLLDWKKSKLKRQL